MNHTTVFNPPLRGKDGELFGHVVRCMTMTDFVRPEDLQAWIKGRPGWSNGQLKASLDQLKSQGALLEFPEGLKPVTHLKE